MKIMVLTIEENEIIEGYCRRVKQDKHIKSPFFADTRSKKGVFYMAVAHKGSISMGMVLIPVGLYKTTVDNDIHFKANSLSFLDSTNSGIYSFGII